MKKLAFLLRAALALASCNRKEEKADAYGNFEATEVTVSSQEAGELLFFIVEEGNTYGFDSLVGLIDTTQYHLNRLQLKASRQAIAAQTGTIASQIDVLTEQQRNADREYQRFRKMASEGAATQKQVDDLKGQIDIYSSQISSIRTQNAPVLGNLNAIDAQIAQVENHINHCYIRTPIKGVVLTKTAEASEIVAPGKPLYRIADMDNIYLRVYVSGDQMPNLKLGQQVEVLVDKDEKTNRQLTGTISWIASKAEFTPKIIQTKEERVNLVYAVKVKVPNDGTLKIGMPGEVNF
jgi:HlyD family secretion protein